MSERAMKRAMRATNSPARGFSLIELMIVLVIIGLLAGLVGPQLMKQLDSSKVSVAETQIKMLRGALQTYRLDVGTYPSTAQGLGRPDVPAGRSRRILARSLPAG